MIKTSRLIALEILNRIDKEGGHADAYLGSSFTASPDLSSREKAFITELVYGVLRRRNSLDWVLAHHAAQPQRRISRQIKNLLRLGIYQVIYLSRVPVPVSVSASVRLAKALTNEKIASMVNGLLRAVARNRETLSFPSLQEDMVQAISVRYSHPAWLVQLWLHQLGPDDTTALCKVNNTPPPFTIRTNTLRVAREKLIATLKDEGVSGEATRHSPEGIVLSHPADITRLPSFRKGWFFVQDEAAQLISFLVSPQAGERVLELCAAPGGKTTHLAQLMKDRGLIIAVDWRRHKVALLQENQERLGIRIINPLSADALHDLPFSPGTLFDKILLDAPCSGLGILRRHPEGKWNKSPALITRLKTAQLTMLHNASRYVKQGGILVYSTCTTTPEENGGVVEEFLAEAEHRFEPEDPAHCLPFQGVPPVDGRGYLQTLPHRDAMDGFFGARLRRVT
jgi:16S rRNA (cytosine967-C5)-methyltransferase